MTTTTSNDIDQMRAKAQRDVQDANAVLEEARRRREATEQQVTGSQAELDRLTAEAAAKKQAIDAARRARIDADAELRKAEEQARLAEANLPQAAVTAEVAELIATRVLDAFDRYRGDGDHAGSRQAVDAEAQSFWEVIDSSRDRLLTVDVTGDAAATVAGIEGVIFACERWEEDRASVTDPYGQTASLGLCPPENHHVQKFERDLRRCLAGESPNVTLPAFGSMIIQGLSFEQIAKTVTLTRPNGSICTMTLAALVDAGGKEGKPEFISTVWMGCRSFEAAWQKRQADVDRRRRQRNEKFGRPNPWRIPYANPVSHPALFEGLITNPDPMEESINSLVHRNIGSAKEPSNFFEKQVD